MPAYAYAALLVLTMGLAVVAGLAAAIAAGNVPKMGYVPLVSFAAVSFGLIVVVATVVGVNMYVFNIYPEWWMHGARVMRWVDCVVGIVFTACVTAALLPLSKVKSF